MKWSSTVFTVILLAASTLVSGICLAGEYKLVEGAGVPVCEAYRRNLEPRRDERPMACERQYDPSIRGFTQLAWRRLDLQSNLDLYGQAAYYLATHNFSSQGSVLSEAAARESERNVAARARGLGGELYVTSVDLGANGGRVNLLALRERACGPDDPAPMMTRLFVLDASMKKIDLERQISLQDWYNNGTLVLFEGTVYIEGYSPDDNWGTLLTGSGELHVAEFAVEVWSDDPAEEEGRPVAPSETCLFRYSPAPIAGNDKRERW